MSGRETTSVLVLEDDADDYRIISKGLRSTRCQFVVQWAKTLAEAVDSLRRHRYDVVITDLSVPDCHGLETVSQIKSHSANTPVIVLTGLDDDEIEKQILAAGAQDYLVKDELGDRAVARAVLHAVQRQDSANEVNALVEQLEISQHLLEEYSLALHKKNQRLTQLNKTAQEFVDNVSHDLRTPLTVIKDYVSIIGEGMVGDVNDEQKAMLNKVSVRADDLNIMVDDLLDVSKLESGLLGAWRRNCRAKEVFQRLESLLQQRAAAKNVELTIDCPADLPDVYCDADKVGRVVTNLAVNAIKFAGDQGQVRISAEVDPAGQQIVVSIADNGPGIAKESLDQIFKRFRQINSHLKSTVKGFGLGLNIAQNLCHLNLGELSVRSQLGQGSTFSFTLPLADPTEVFRRWLDQRNRDREWLQLIAIEIDEDSPPAACSDFDSFANCLLRNQDLLFRVASGKWLLIADASQSESEQWFRRAEKEFDAANRNRPWGPLPQYQATTMRQWTAQDLRDVIVTEFDDAVANSAFPAAAP